MINEIMGTVLYKNVNWLSNKENTKIIDSETLKIIFLNEHTFKQINNLDI